MGSLIAVEATQTVLGKSRDFVSTRIDAERDLWCHRGRK